MIKLDVIEPCDLYGDARTILIGLVYLHYVQLQNSIEALGVYALPTTLIYDRSGKEIHRLLGDRGWTSEKTLLFFKNILHE